jgi:predicted KAP-like P-loop ATPase
MDKDQKAIFQALTKPASQETRAAAEDILKQLFPEPTTYNEGVLYRELLVCHPDVFNRYFLLSIPEGDISQAELDALLAATNDREQLVGLFDGLRERSLLSVALDRLEAYKQEVDLVNAVPFISALFDIGDNLPEGEEGMFVISTWMHAARIIRWYLLKEPDPGKRREYVIEAMNISDGLYLPSMSIALAIDAQKEGQSQSDRVFDENAVDDLKLICVDKIRKAASSGRLTVHSQLGTLLGIWSEWAGADEPRAWVDHLTQSDEGIIRFLEAITGKATSSGGGDSGPREVWYIQLQAVEKFIDSAILLNRIEKLGPRAQTESEIRALKALNQALERRRRGKDGRPWLDWSPED